MQTRDVMTESELRSLLAAHGAGGSIALAEIGTKVRSATASGG
jgi:hypothetical protein